MISAQRVAGVWGSAVQGAVVGGLCVLLVAQPMVAGARPFKKKVAVKQIQGDDKVLHALNRFTFGPQPGDVARVREMGLARWFEEQLNPAQIDDSSLEARLTMYPAMQMQQAELMERYPSQPVVRQIIKQNLPLPLDPMPRAMYADQIAFYKSAQAKKQASKAAADGMNAVAGDGQDVSMKAGDSVDPSMSTMAVREAQFYSRQEAVKILSLPPDARMQKILAMSPDDLVAFRKSLRGNEVTALTGGLSPIQKERLEALQGSQRMVEQELLASRMLRDVYSERQLEAVMTDFWLNHFNVFIHKDGNEPFLLPAYERDVIRPHALGRFEDLLVATAQSPAMLMYLDNWQSMGPDSVAVQKARNPQGKQPANHGLNENYARELMELHTLGVACEVSQDHPAKKLNKSCGRGYTQQDVVQVAEVLTGWTIDRPFRGAADFHFDPRRHEPGTKMVLGVKIGEQGQSEGLQVLHLLATSPATAQFISNKLAVRFVSDDPPKPLVDRMAKAFLASNGDIKTVLKTMFNSPEFWSQDAVRAKVKTPLEFVASAARASGVEIANPAPLAQQVAKLGMPLYGMQTPNGYSWMAAPWVNTGDLVNRMNFALMLSGDHLAGTQTDWTRFLGEAPGLLKPVSLNASGDEVVAKEHALETLLLGQPASDRTRETVLAQFEAQVVQPNPAKNFEVRVNAQPVSTVLNQASMPGRPKTSQQDKQAAAMAGLLLGSPDFQRR